MNRNWNMGGLERKIFHIDPSRTDRVDDDVNLVLIINQSGDCFYTMTPLKQLLTGDSAGLKGCPDEKFGDYTRILGNDTGIKLTDREFHLLAAGEEVEIKADRYAE